MLVAAVGCSALTVTAVQLKLKVYGILKQASVNTQSGCAGELFDDCRQGVVKRGRVSGLRPWASRKMSSLWTAAMTLWRSPN